MDEEEVLLVEGLLSGTGETELGGLTPDMRLAQENKLRWSS